MEKPHRKQMLQHYFAKLQFPPKIITNSSSLKKMNEATKKEFLIDSLLWKMELYEKLVDLQLLTFHTEWALKKFGKGKRKTLLKSRP